MKKTSKLYYHINTTPATPGSGMGRLHSYVCSCSYDGREFTVVDVITDEMIKRSGCYYIDAIEYRLFMKFCDFVKKHGLVIEIGEVMGLSKSDKKVVNEFKSIKKVF